MALERKQTISAITIHFATQDIFDEGVLQMTKGTMKQPRVEWLTWIEEDGVPIKGTYTRKPVRDDEVETQLTGEALTVVRGLKKIIRDRGAA